MDRHNDYLVSIKGGVLCNITITNGMLNQMMTIMMMIMMMIMMTHPHDVDHVLAADGAVVLVVGSAAGGDGGGAGAPAADC